MSTQEMENTREAKLDFNAECTACGASIEFNPNAGNLKCPYCGHETDIARPENEDDQVAQELDFSTAEQTGNFDWGTDKKTVICKSCSAETIYDALQTADSCPYCGSNQVMESNDTNSLAPNGVCVFEVTDKQAGENFQTWIKGKWFTPSEAKRSARADAFEGVYIPYWTFDTKTSSRYTAKYGIDRTVKDRDGKERTETDWYTTSGFYQEFIDDHLIMASTRYDRNMLNELKPFNVLNNKVYQPEYVTGFLAERYSIGLKEGWNLARKEIHAHLEDQIENTIRRNHHADSVSNVQFSTTHENITYKYLLVPIWLSSFQFKDKVYQFMVNGQTGKVSGDAPISPLRVTIAILVTLLVLAMLWYFFAS
ncbi:MAG: hypothetical protein ABS948_16785 [Solibacillus sp.]